MPHLGPSLCNNLSEKRCLLLGELLINFTISLTMSFLTASCRHRLRECARQCTERAAGASFLMTVARPFLFPCIKQSIQYLLELSWQRYILHSSLQKVDWKRFLIRSLLAKSAASGSKLEVVGGTNASCFEQYLVQ